MMPQTPIIAQLKDLQETLNYNNSRFLRKFRHKKRLQVLPETFIL